MRHAYLIIAHGNFEILEKQLRFLDSENADFFIHIDRRVKDFDFEKFRSVPEKSKVTFVDRVRVSWGHFSQIESELNLLRAAVPGHYEYYHLLSGVDVPIKSRDYIERFFTMRPGVNYVNFHIPMDSDRFRGRVKYYYPFQRINVRDSTFLILCRKASTGIQRLFRVNRTRRFGAEYRFQKGANWFSITHAFAEYVLENEGDIRRTYRCGFCVDEVFLQTLMAHSSFLDTLYSRECGFDHRTCLRLIDWERGQPYTFSDSDFEMLTHTAPDYLFARKFDYARNAALVDRLFAFFTSDMAEKE